MAKYYEPTGQAPFHGHALAYIIGIVLAFFASMVYNFIMVIIPFVYLNLFIAGGYAVVLGYIIKSASKIGLQRTYRERLNLCIAVCSLSLIFEWAAYINYLQHGFDHLFDVSQILGILLRPADLFKTIEFVNENGAWQIFGTTFKGLVLSIIWFLEAALIFVLPIRLCQTHVLSPYSNLLDKWYRKYTLNNFFESIALANEFEARLEAEGIQPILELKYGLATRYAEVTVFFLPDENIQYLSISNVYVGARGGNSRSETELVQLLVIDTTSADLLMKKYGTKKPFFLDY